MMYAMWGRSAQSWISYKGKVLIHDNQGEMEFLFPGAVVRPITVRPEEGMSIKDHPECAHYRWPIRKEDFC